MDAIATLAATLTTSIVPAGATATPALAPPPGVTPNFDNPPDTLAPATDITAAVTIALTTAAIIARFVTKYWVIGNFRWDDWLALASWVFFVAFTSVFIYAAQHGAGRHTWDVPKSSLPEFLKVVWILEILWAPLMLAAKLSICIQILNLFAGGKKGHVFWVVQVMIVFNLGIFGLSFFIVTFGCNPISKAWQPELPGHCINNDILSLVSALWNVIADIITWILPLYTVWHLKIPLQKKLAICAVFFTAFFAPVSAVCRLLYSILSATTNDRVYALQQLGLWSLAEATIYILCGFMPLAPKFLQLIRGRTRSRRYDPTPNSVHRSVRFLQRRFTVDQDPTLRSAKDPWLNPDEMTMKLTGLNSQRSNGDFKEERSHKHFNVLRSGHHGTAHGGHSRTDISPDDQDRSFLHKSSSEIRREDEEVNPFMGMGIMKTVRIETDARPASSASADRDSKPPRAEIWSRRK